LQNESGVGTQISQVGDPRKKPVIGIVGGIASGKSTVAAEFAKLGCAVIDADAIAHDVLETDSIRGEIARRFGAGILDGEGRIDRKKLAAVVFSEGRKLALLNRVIHPHVLRRTEELIAQYGRDDRVAAIVLDMPLLIEVGWENRCDRVVFVYCSWQRRLERANKAGGVSESEIKIRENFQISLDTKARLADNTIDNNSGFSALVRQITNIFSDIIKNS